ncbi:cation:proton antiporter [soil metagenome]
MTDVEILRDLGYILLGATLLALVARVLRIPSIIGYIAAGLLLGPLLGLVTVSHSVEVISEIGIILLLFLVGLELSIDKIREVGKVAFAVGGAQMAVTGISVAAIAWVFGLSGGQILFLGVALTFSSTVVVVKLLDQVRSLDTRHGRIAVGVLLVQDLAVVLVLTIVAGLSGGTEPSAAELARDLGGAFGGTVVLLAAAVAAARWLLPPVFRWVAGQQQALFIFALSACFLFVLVSEWLHLSVELGAFLAGVSLAQLPYNHDLRRRVHPLMNFFVAIFFVSLGIQMELGAALDAWGLVLTLVVFTLLLKPPLIAHLVRLMGERPRIAMRSGLTLGQTSEFSFILGALALSNGLIEPELLSIVGAVGLLTMGISSFSVVNGDRLVESIASRGLLPLLAGGEPQGESLAVEEGADAECADGEAGPTIVVGMNALGRAVVHGLRDRGHRVVAIDTDPKKLEGLDVPTVLGNAEYLSVLDEAGLSSCSLLVSTLQIEDVNRLLAYRARDLGIPSVIHVFDRGIEEELEDLGVTHLLNSRAAGVRSILEELSGQGAFRP